MGLVWLFVVAAALVVVLITAVIIHRTLYPARKTYAVALGRGMPTEPHEMNLGAEDRDFTFPDGSTTPGWVIEGQAREGPVVVVSHGWSDSRYGSLLRVPYLTPFASQVVIYDLRAHGDSTAARCKLGTVEVDDLLAVIEQAVDPQDQVVLFGSSLGAGVSIVAAVRSENGGASSGASGGRSRERRRLAKVAGVIADGPYRQALEPIVGYMRYYRVFPYPSVWLAWAHVEFWYGGLRGFDRAAHAKQLDCPLLVMHGTRDCISRYESGRAIAEAAPQGTLVTFEDGGHTDLAWSNPKLYHQALQAFFADLNMTVTAESSDTINASVAVPR